MHVKNPRFSIRDCHIVHMNYVKTLSLPIVLHMSDKCLLQHPGVNDAVTESENDIILG